MSLKGFSYGTITLDEPRDVYYSGQVIRGTVEFELDKPVDFSVIQIQYIGEAKVLWTETQVVEYNQIKRTIEEKYRANEKYFDISRCLAGTGGRGVYQLLPGKHSATFQYQIPATAPSSFKGKMGNVEYCIIVSLEYQDSLVSKELIIKYFDVIAPFDLNYGNPAIREPIEIEFEEVYPCCLCTPDPVLVCVRLPVSGYCPGQIIPALITAKNDSKFEISKVIIQLTRKEKYYSTQPRSEYTPEETVLSQLKKGPVMSNTKREFKVELIVPDMVAPNLENCHIIDVGYFVKVIVKMSGCNSDMQDYSEICMGLFPLTEFAQGYEHPMKHNLPTGPLPDSNRPDQDPVQTGFNAIEVLKIPDVPDSAPPPYPVEIQSGNRDNPKVSGQTGFSVTGTPGFNSFKEYTAPYPVSSQFKANYHVHENISSRDKFTPYPVETNNTLNPIENSKPPYPIEPNNDAPYPIATNKPPYPMGMNIPVSNLPKPTPARNCEIGFKMQDLDPPYPTENRAPSPSPYPQCPYPTENKMPSLPNLAAKSPYYMSDLSRRPRSQDLHINLPLLPSLKPNEPKPSAPSAPPSSP